MDVNIVNTLIATNGRRDFSDNDIKLVTRIFMIGFKLIGLLWHALVDD